MSRVLETSPVTTGARTRIAVKDRAVILGFDRPAYGT
jgi:hypothetical protein